MRERLKKQQEKASELKFFLLMEIIPPEGVRQEHETQRWDEDKAALVRWDDWNRQYPEESFSNQEVALAYPTDRPILFSWHGPINAVGRREVASWLSKRKDWLDQFEERLDLFDDPPRETEVKQTINIHGQARVGQVGLAITNLENRITGVEETGQSEMAQALAMLTQAVVDELPLDTGRRAELLQNLEDLGEQATRPVEERKQGRIRAAIEAIAAAAAAGSQLHQVWTAWEPTIRQLLPH